MGAEARRTVLDSSTVRARGQIPRAPMYEGTFRYGEIGSRRRERDNAVDCQETQHLQAKASQAISRPGHIALALNRLMRGHIVSCLKAIQFLIVLRQQDGGHVARGFGDDPESDSVAGTVG